MILFGLCVICFVVSWFLPENGEIVLLAFSGMFFVIGTITQGCNWYCQANDIEEIEQQKQDQKIYKTRNDELLGEFKLYLAEMYPEIEKGIFSTITPTNVTAFMIKYPEMKSSETITKLVNLINNLKSQYYQCDLTTNNLQKRIRVRRKTISMWVFPILPG